MDKRKSFVVELTNDEFVALANLHITLQENMEGLKNVEDFECGGSVAEILDLSGLRAVLQQVAW